MVDVSCSLKKLWKGICTVYVRLEVQNQVNKRMEFIESPIYKNQKCKLSYENITATDSKGNVSVVGQKTKLFISNEIDIPAGSKIEIAQNGKTVWYKRSGQPAVYTNHQELELNLFKGWA